MPYAVLKSLARRYSGAIGLEKLLPHGIRSSIAAVLGMLVTALFIPLVLYLSSLAFPAFAAALMAVPAAAFLLPKLVGLFCIIFALWLCFFAAEGYYYSFYFSALDAILTERGIGEAEPVSFGVALLAETSDAADLTKSFVKNEEGEMILFRTGLTRQDVQAFLEKRTARVSAAAFSIASGDGEFGITMADYALAILKSDKEFSQFLFEHSIDEWTFLGAAEWIVRTGRARKKAERWWSRDNLGRIEGIGKDWAYGAAYILDRYSKHIFDKGTSLAVASSNYLHAEVEAVEKILARTEEANALIVGETESAPRDVVFSFSRAIQEGRILPALEHKRVVVLDTNKLTALNGDKSKFELELEKIMHESTAAGNIILVFDDFAGFIASAAELGADVLSVIDPFIASARLQVIAISDKARFHAVLESNPLIMSRFEKVQLDNSGVESTIGVLEAEAERFEARNYLIFTYPAIETIAMGADRYIAGGVMPDKAVSLLVDLVPALRMAQKRTVTKEDVLAFIQTKTGIPTGAVSSEEKDKLINLEALLHKRVVGQDEAVKAVANAMRRARSGIGNPNRPMGSFLFLGPTGVGKTETTKALAEAFFGSADKINRLDMSEYKSADAMDKLIGSFTSKSPGVLSSMLREHPYGVLLLDEFEKASKEVTDLFLQVLDEGFFSDMAGNKVNARNLIIIATSNAGADLIWQYLEKGGDLESHKNEVLDGIVQSGTFRPELLNRFDGVILFHPVDEPHLRDIAKLALEKFREQLRERGVDLKVNEALVNFLMKFGTDPKFGARPMNRAIQDTVEQNIADRLIKGEIKTGETVEFTEAELDKLSLDSAPAKQ